jgi:hypothetical protein
VTVRGAFALVRALVVAFGVYMVLGGIVALMPPQPSFSDFSDLPDSPRWWDWVYAVWAFLVAGTLLADPRFLAGHPGGFAVAATGSLPWPLVGLALRGPHVLAGLLMPLLFVVPLALQIVLVRRARRCSASPTTP